ncbi:MAG: peptidylprolyl isomerase [Clostridia bacterium]|nr:peptidylprolyl isomerase [Clostridia bacterium]
MIRLLKHASALITALALLFVFGCAETKDDSVSHDTAVGDVDGIRYSATQEKTNFVLLTVSNNTGGGRIIIELYPDIAPLTVENYKELVQRKFYDGIIFHRVIKNFMIQAGDPTGTGYHGSGTNITGEFAANGFENNLLHTRGVVSMARGKSYDSASSQFFICHADSPHLNGQYAAFGKVIAGMSTVDAVASVKTDANDRPLSEQKIVSAQFVNIVNDESDTEA